MTSRTDPADEWQFILQLQSRVISLLAKEAGYDAIQTSALHTLNDRMESYMEKLLQSAHGFAELANRHKPNYYDLTRAFTQSGVQLTSFGEYLQKLKADDHLQRLAPQPEASVKEEEKIPQFLPSDDEEEESDEEESTIPSYVPDHMPKFPSKHSYKQTPVYIRRPDDPQRVRELNSQQSRVVEENLKRLMSAENQLVRPPEPDGLDMMGPVVNYESAAQRKKRVKRAASSLHGPRRQISSSLH
ncbi:hypothetical protein BCR43DRAFT_499223 [Syncephalastrum racemosum]|uniref:Transcription initiation factor TFIID subunit 8 n=1 Tax=Syncephalastrum racemosum TaxID=13706 RepID=A0A1X2GZY8_SYNRA|nr:hypothetical protein BCR43DRAFT_499223 [Syncephalastrum racemosum]